MKILTLISNILKNKEIYKYGIVSVGAASFVLFMTWLLTSVFGIFHAYSVAVSVESGIIWTFFILDRWTFKKIEKKHNTVRRFLQYNLVGIGSLGINEGILLSLTYGFKMYYLYAEFFAIMITFCINFFLNKNFSWASRKETY
jgi:putative flippase GtrA